ncbi:hypothetical protein FCL47_18115 [Desulfopila sp. IMCC35006]|uniref:NifB/NifX family molybdenum-iron cluster-binding protein n=1 Tax=Desulfopila sp. IMCC35006 TaxID=2569542 RepID=UPI0010ACCC33|nr:hypothetical protein [Desulfopila sp. IMCC35006]TKB24400.1 hypothetical protein FCL47_18115 [Desulfopila sp. IMCC35006]
MKIMMTTRGDYISPRFDMSAEVIIATCYDRQLLEEPHSLVLSEMSAELLCDLVLKENIGVVVCGGIEEEHYQFLIWKKIMVFDAVIGPHAEVLRLVMDNSLKPGAMLSRVTSREGAL